MTDDQPPAADVPRLLLTPEEAARCLGIGRTKLFALLRSRRLPSVLLDGSRRIRTSDLVAFAEGLPAETGAELRAVPSNVIGA